MVRFGIVGGLGWGNKQGGGTRVWRKESLLLALPGLLGLCMSLPPPVLTVAGSDNSAGAGIQADLKTMSALGVYGLTAVTCVVAEVPGKVSAIQGIDPVLVEEQVRLLFSAFPVAAIKTGMLYSKEILNAVADVLGEFRAQSGGIPLVVDPVMVATSGDSLLQPEAVAVYRERLFPSATLVTPNLDEASALLGGTIVSRAQMREAGQELVKAYGSAFLMKGGHLKEESAADLLVEKGGAEHWYEAPFVRDVSTHGTGCTYSAAIASELAKGLGLRQAVGQAKRFVTRAVSAHLRWTCDGRSTDALDHFAPR
jgi:hydroxymethylpyrimidine/phosphomethylpyrimidine kinase